MKKNLLTLIAVCCIISSSYSQILNGGFENWNGGLPDNWWGYNLPQTTVFSQTNSAHTGNYAVKLQVEDFNGQPFTSALSTGNGSAQTHPLTFIPGSVSFWYELNPVSGDEITLSALVYSGGTGSGFAILALPAAANYTYANVPITYGVPPASVDSISIIFLITHSSGASHIGSEAKIDDVSANVGAGIENHFENSDRFELSPNPANDFINIEFENSVKGNYEVYILDEQGKQVYNRSFKSNSKGLQIETSAFRPGIYYCIINSGNRRQMTSFVVKHD